MYQKEQPTRTVNGVDVEHIAGTIQAVRQNPNLADFKFGLSNNWITGGHSQAQISQFYGAGATQQREQEFTLDADEPPVLAGHDQGPNPVEYLLTALSACLTGTLAYHAAVRGIEIEGIESQSEGNIDLHGFLDLDPNVRRGYKEIRVKFKVQSDADEAKLLELLKKPPVYDAVTNPTPVKLSVEKV